MAIFLFDKKYILSIMFLMKTIWNFFLEHKYAIFWTVGYFCVVWAILFFLFNFDFFNGAQWHRLMRAQLRGFPGFVFGLLMLATVPLYIATVTLVVRKKKPLITIPMPSVKLPTLIAKKSVEEEKKVGKEPEKKDTESPENNLPKDLPLEMRPVFLRAQQNLLFMQQSGAVLPEIDGVETNVVGEESEGLPVPMDFDVDFDVDDIDDVDEEVGGMGGALFGAQGAPVFKDIDFSDGGADNNQEYGQVAGAGDNISRLVKYLSDKKQDFVVEDNIVITDKYAIATHADKDFWVTDAENWFAAGKACESPIVCAKRMAEKYSLIPAIYLEEKNILDIDKLIPQWKQDGVLVITDLSSL